MSECGEGHIEWILTVFGECVITERDKWSFGIGMVSNFIWLIASIPQYIQSCKTKEVEGQSPFFFSLLFTGNLLSLIGLIITGVYIVTQLITSIIYVLLDGFLFAQYVYYRWIYPKCHQNDNKKEQKNDEPLESGESPVATGIVVAATAVALAVDYGKPYRGTEVTGTLFGWASSLIYIGCRLPQIIKNFKDKIVRDLSPLYSFFGVLGNLTYTLSLFIKSIEPQFCWEQAPWIVGALGPMTCDITLLIQMTVFGLGGSKDVDDAPVGEDDFDNDIDRIPEL